MTLFLLGAIFGAALMAVLAYLTVRVTFWQERRRRGGDISERMREATRRQRAANANLREAIEAKREAR